MSGLARNLRSRSEGKAQLPLQLWGSDLHLRENEGPVMSFEEAAHGGAEGTLKMLTFLVRYGIVLIKGTPPNVEDTQRLSESIGPIKNTLYGGMWSTNPSSKEQAFNDTAYGSDALPLHTDGTYFHDPPGLQIFHCVQQGKEGGASCFMDGFAVAERLRYKAPYAFNFFSQVPFQYQCFDNGCYLLASGPIFKLHPAGHVVQVRHNDTDQVPVTHLSEEEVLLFYKAHSELGKILNDKSMILERVMRPGETFILNNHRVLHGRQAFQGKRRMIGCYIGRDEFESHARHLGLIR